MSSLNTQTSTTSAEASNDDSRSEGNNNNRSRNNRRNGGAQATSSNPITYEGECEKVGCILALKVEKFHKKVSYEIFVEKICNYVVQNYTDGEDIKVLLTHQKDPIKEYEANNMPGTPSAEDINNPVKEAILREEIKQFVARKNNIRRNIQSVYSLLWGQCSASLQAYIKGQDGYIKSTESYDVKWLMSELRKASSGVDSKANPYLTMLEATSTVFKMRQGSNESNDTYVERF